jgi:Tol biopolymer transport system component
MRTTKSYRKITFQLISICVLSAFILPAASTQANGFEPIGYWLDPVLLPELNGDAWSQPTLHKELNGPEDDPAKRPCLSTDGLRIYFQRYIPALGHNCIVEAARLTPTGPFNLARILTELAATGGRVETPWISGDQLRLYYSEKVDDVWRMKMAQRSAIGDSWTPTKTFDELIHPNGDSGMVGSLTSDELTIFFQSKRPGSVTVDYSNLWMATRLSTDDLFTELRPLDEINSTVHDHSPYIMSDGLTLYFTSNRTPLEGIYKATRTSTGEFFGNVERLSVSAEIYKEFHPHVTPDQKTIYFYSDHGVEGNGIWISKLEPDPQGDPASGPCLSGDGLRIYFAREISALGNYCIIEATRPTPTGPFTSERVLTELAVTGYNLGKPWISPDQLRLYYHESDGTILAIKMAQRSAVGDSWTPTQTFDELNTGGWHAMACSLTADELTIVLHSNRPGSMGQPDLWMATRPSTDDPFIGLTPLDTINSVDFDGTPYITPDGLTLYFNSNRGGLNGDIYKTTRASTADLFDNVELVPISTDTYRERNPHVTPDQKTIYFNRGIKGTPDEGIWISHWIGSSYDVALNSIRAAIADKTAAIDKITEAIDKELTAVRALIDAPSELTNKAISKAKKRLLSSMKKQIKARIELRRGLRELERVFKDITNPPAANHAPPHHPHRRPGPKPRTGPTLRPGKAPPRGVGPRR